MSVKLLSPLVPPSMTSAQRDAIPAGRRPPGSMIWNTTTSRVERNFGSDATPNWQQVAPDSLSAGDIAANAIGASELADNAVDTAAIADANVTLAKLAANSVDASKIVDGSVGSAEIADGSIVSGDIAAGTIVGDRLDWNYGTSPPGSPVDGMLWCYQGSGFYWKFVYQSAEATYKWKFIGGGWLASQAPANATAGWTQNTWGFFYGTNPAVTLPRAGDYLVVAVATAYPVSAGASWWIGINIGGTNPTLDQTWTAGGYSAVASARHTLTIHTLGTSFGAGVALQLVHQQAAPTQNFVRYNAVLQVQPLRVI